jgi:hypothetical protein
VCFYFVSRSNCFQSLLTSFQSASCLQRSFLKFCFCSRYSYRSKAWIQSHFYTKRCTLQQSTMKYLPRQLCLRLFELLDIYKIYLFLVQKLYSISIDSIVVVVEFSSVHHYRPKWIILFVHHFPSHLAASSPFSHPVPSSLSRLSLSFSLTRLNCSK